MPPDTVKNDRPSQRRSTTSGGRLVAGTRRLVRHERALWGLVVAVLCTDVLSTYYGLTHGHTEGNPVVRGVLADGGFVAFTTLKLAAVSLAVAVWVVMSRKRRVVVPLGLALPWAGTTLVNLVTILG